MKEEKEMKTEVVIVGTGVGGLFCALHLPKTMSVLMISKKEPEESDSFLAQGGICVLRDEKDYDSYFEDTMRAGHYENRKESVDIMIRSSREVIEELIGFGVEFASKEGELLYTREGAHSKPRILYHEDITGKEITSKLLEEVKRRPNIKILSNTTMIDWMIEKEQCRGIVCITEERKEEEIFANQTVLATGGIGGLYEHSTNYRHLTGDSITLAKRYKVRLENLNYVQIHPTTLYSKESGRRFLISESVRGEGAKLYNAKMERFIDELLPRDIVTEAIYEQMKKDNMPFVWLSMKEIPEEVILKHFPNIYTHCLEKGYDVRKENIPVVPAQHYFMGGIWVDTTSHTSMKRLYAVGETSCNGVHGANRLASNSLLESLVFAKRAAENIKANKEAHY